MRFIMMGSKALTDGFALLGFEIFPDATIETVEMLLSDLLKNKQKALVFLENNLSQNVSSQSLLRVRTEAVGVIITEIPPLNAPETYRPAVEDLILRVLGPAALD